MKKLKMWSQRRRTGTLAGRKMEPINIELMMVPVWVIELRSQITSARGILWKWAQPNLKRSIFQRFLQLPKALEAKRNSLLLLLTILQLQQTKESQVLRDLKSLISERAITKVPKRIKTGPLMIVLTISLKMTNRN